MGVLWCAAAAHGVFQRSRRARTCGTRCIPGQLVDVQKAHSVRSRTDEFNRIEAEVLSVVSSQIKQIQEALRHGVRRFPFEGREIGIDSRTGIFITMNPGYAGRTELPGAQRRARPPARVTSAHPQHQGPPGRAFEHVPAARAQIT